jgi:hypothetical protein
VRNAQNSPPGFCAVATFCQSLLLGAQRERPPKNAIHRRTKFQIVKELTNRSTSTDADNSVAVSGRAVAYSVQMDISDRAAKNKEKIGC